MPVQPQQQLIPNSSTNVKYDYTLDKYVADELHNYMNVVGGNLSKAQLNNLTTQLKNAINPKASQTPFQFLKVGRYRNVNYTNVQGLLQGKGVLSGEGKAFVEAAMQYNLDPVYLIAQSALETGWGTSNFAKGITINQIADTNAPIYKDGVLVGYKMIKLAHPVTVYNLFGIAAYNNKSSNEAVLLASNKATPVFKNETTIMATTYAYEHGWTSVSKAIFGAAQFLSENYVHNPNIAQDTPYELRFIDAPNGDIWHQYSSDIQYAETIGEIMSENKDLYANGDTFQFAIPEFNAPAPVVKPTEHHNDKTTPVVKPIVKPAHKLVPDEHHKHHSDSNSKNIVNGVIINLGKNREAHLHMSPNDHSKTIERLVSGTHVKVLEKVGSWDKVQLQDGQIGFVDARYITNPDTSVQPTHHNDIKPVQPIHTGSTNPDTPVHHNVMAAPTLTAHNYKLIIGRDFNNSMLGAKASEGAKISYEGHVNTMKPGSYTIKVTATNSQGESTVANVIVQVLDVAPVINAENYTMTQGQAFNLSDLHISAHSQLGNDLTKDVKVSGTVDTMKAGVYKLTLTVTDQFGSTNERVVEVTVNKAAAPEFTCNKEVTTPYGVKVSDNELGINILNNQSGKDIIAVSGNPDYTKAGTYDMTVTVTNQYGESTSKVVKIIVLAKEVAPTITGHDYTMTQGQSFSNSDLGVKVTEGAKVTYTGNVDTNKVGTYNVTVTAINSQGTESTKTFTVTVKEKVLPAPVISASSQSIEQGATWNNDMIKATATEGASISYTGNVNTLQAGTYKVTITATNSQGTKSTKVVDVTVEALGAPVINGHNVSLKVGQVFSNSMLGASATVNGKSVQVTYSGNVNNEQEGTYNVTVTANNGYGKESHQTYTVTVNDKVTLVAHNYTMTQGQAFNLSDLDITATNINGTNIADSAKIVSGSVNTNEPGTYNITIEVNDGHGATAEQSVVVTVKAKPVAPVVTASPVTIIAGSQLTDSMFHASANQSDVTFSYDLSNVNTSDPGTYNVVITGTNAQGLSSKTTVEVIVKAKPLAPAKISAQDVTITQGQTLKDSEFNATSNEKGTTFSYDTSNVDTNKPGTYNVTITATNVQGKVSSIDVQVTVKAKPEAVNTFTPSGDNGAGYFTGTNIVPALINNQLVNTKVHINNEKAYILDSQAYYRAYDQMLFEDINQFRVSQGLKPFIWSNDLYFMANWKSTDCMKHDYFTHKDLQGQYTNQVFANQIKFGSWCENLAGGACATSQITVKGNTIILQSQLKAATEATFQAWKASPGHRANMLSDNKYGAVAINNSIVTMEAANPTTYEGTFNPITGTFTHGGVNKFPNEMHNPGPNVFSVIIPRDK